MRVGWSVRQNKHWPLPLPTIDPVVAIELANGHVVPAPTAEDCTGSLENLVGDSAALYVDAPGVLPPSLHCATTQSIESFGPAMKPSNDIVTCQITVPTVVLVLKPLAI
jgi:hypothetical protein